MSRLSLFHYVRFLLITLFIWPLFLDAYSGSFESNLVRDYSQYTGDKSKSLDEISRSFEYVEHSGKVPNLGVVCEPQYIKFYVENKNSTENLFAYFSNPSIDSIELFKIGDELIHLGASGAAYLYNERKYPTTGYLFDLNLSPGESSWYLCKLYSGKQMIVPIQLDTEMSIIYRANTNDNLMSLYFGIILVLIVYNLFLAISTKDTEYYYYVAYLLSVGFTQAALFGYGNTTIWPNNTWLSIHGVHLTGALSGVFTILFVRKFVQSKLYAPIIDKILVVYIGISFVSIAFLICDQLTLSYNLINFNAASSLLLLLAGVMALRKGFQPAKYFILAWSVFLASVTIYALKDFGVLPLTKTTFYSLPVGSALEGLLLSFALASKINTLKREKEEASRELLRTVQDQNEFLEIKVHERTEELEEARNKIQMQYDDLRLAQKQLVESEKMAGLGQMTAGIAHELNNPINFVSSNVAPLHRDIQDILTMLDDYIALGDNITAEDIQRLKKKHQEMGLDFIKTEIDALLKGIEEGSRRTAEIVRGLRVFARSDKDELILANINDCLQSTLVVLKSVTKGQVTLTKEFDPNMPSIYCYPGKLNQVIVNLVTNAVHATARPDRTHADRHVIVKSYFNENEVCLSIKDNGHGIDDEVMEKIFIPFFTTKGVGEGTGLGLSISRGIVEEHKGHIEVLTEKNIGTEFIIHLPRLENSGQTSVAS